MQHIPAENGLYMNARIFALIDLDFDKLNQFLMA